jgi:glycosyltransferase involved in cell wall biosynthesis
MAKRVSVIVVNYNYARFLAQAVDSVLAQTYPHVDVTVVDDGSTDGSRDLVASYGDAVRPLFKPNGGMASAVNAAVAAATGDIVMILDADDFLRPEAVARVVEAWRPGCSKVQYRLSLVDASGSRFGVDPPEHVDLPTGDVVPRIALTGIYPTPVTAGNAYDRKVLERVLPIPESGTFRNSADGYLNPVVPFYGDVVSVAGELACYRIHGDNLWAVRDDVSLDRLVRGVRHELEQQECMAAVAGRLGRPWPPDVMLRNPEHVIKRLATRRLAGARHPVPSDSVPRLVVAGVRAVVRDRTSPPVDRALQLVLVLAVAVLPRSAVLPPVGWVYGGRARPAWVSGAAGALRRLRMRGAGGHRTQ